MKLSTITIFTLSSLFGFSQNEPHLKNLTMLTHGGDNAEAYFSFDGK